MSWKTTLWLFVGVILTGSFIWFFERGSETTQERLAQKGLALRIKPGDVEYLAITSGAVSVECRREDETWWIVSPLRARADGGAIDRILYGLQDLRRHAVVTASERRERGLSAADYGLDKPRGIFVYGDGRGMHTVMIGRDSPLGDNVYAAASVTGDVMAVERRIVDLLPESLAALRDRALVHAGRTEIQRFGIRRPAGYLQVTRDEIPTPWKIEQPIRGRANTLRVEELVDDLVGLRIAKFVADDVKDATVYGLAEPAYRLTLWRKDKGGPMILGVGRKVEGDEGLVYVKWEGNASIYAVTNRLLELLDTPLEKLRDHHLIAASPTMLTGLKITKGDQNLELLRTNGEWMVVSPREMAADSNVVEHLLETWAGVTIREFIDEGVTNLEKYGLEQPAMVLEFEAGGATGRTVIVKIGSRAAGKGRLPVRVEGESSVYIIDERAVGKTSLDPLRYRDRRVLDVSVADVRGLELDRRGKRQSVRRNKAYDSFEPGEKGEWKVLRAHLDEVMDNLCHLRASEYVAENPGDLGVYGLDKPRATLTVYLAPEAGIAKTLMIGDRDEDRFYAMIRGGEVVFLLEKNVVDMLTADLYERGAVSEETRDEGKAESGKAGE